MSSAEKSDNVPEPVQDMVHHTTSTVVINIADTWSASQEKLLKAISERSNCMRWLHTQCTGYFETLNFYFTIPNIVISTLNGSITMSLTALFPNPRDQQNATTVIGLVSILSAVLITMNQYVKSQQMAEAHHSAGLSYGKLYRTIMNELALRRDQRTNGLEFLKQVRSEIDRLESTEPPILPFAVKQFNKQFLTSAIEKPEITGDLDPVEINTTTEDSETMAALPDSSSPFIQEPPEIPPKTLPKSVTDHFPVKPKTFSSKLSDLAVSAVSVILPSFKQEEAIPAVSEKQYLTMQENETTNVIVEVETSKDSDDMGYTMMPSSKDSLTYSVNKDTDT